MKRKSSFIIILSVVLLWGASLLTACGGNSAYDEYAKAYDMLQKAESFAVTHHEVFRFFDSETGETTDHELTMETQAVRTDAGYDGISKTVISGPDNYSGEAYYRDGRKYSVTHDPVVAEDLRVSQACEPDYAFTVATQSVFDLQRGVIAGQRAEDTDQGRRLTFSLDPEKIYDLLFAKAYAGVYDGFREPPVYTALLDEEGRLQQVLFSYCLVGDEDEPGYLQSDAQVDFLSWDDIELAFPELNEEDYPDWDTLADQ